MTSFLDCVVGELARARDLHAAISSAHEGYSVILEELDEFWQEVKRKHSDPELMWDELVQVAAMAARTAEDVLRHRPVQLPSAWPGGHDRMTEPSNRMFSFKCSSEGRASVTCLRCGALVAEGRWPRDVYPQAEAHDCPESRS